MPTTVKVRRRKKQPAPMVKPKVSYPDLWDSELEEIRARLEGRRISFVWRSDLSGMVMEETFEVYRVRGFDADTGILQFWETGISRDYPSGALRSFRASDVADIR